MNYYNPVVNFKGSVECDNAPTANNHLTRKQDIAGLSFIKEISPDSSSMLSVVNGALKIDSLAITDVHVDNAQTSLANFISNESAVAASLKEGDVLILTAATGGTLTYMVSGPNGSSAANYTEIESPLTEAEVGAVLNAGDGITVNAANATISANLAAGTGLSSSVSGGQITFSFSGNTDIVSEGSNNLYFSNARARGSLSVASISAPDAQLLSFNSGTGVMSVPASGVHAQFSAGTALSYSNGEFSFSGSTTDVSEGANLYYTDARARAALAAGTGISYTSGTGTIAISLVGGTGIGVAGNTISFNGDSDIVAEGSSNLYFTNARARSAFSVAPVGGDDSQVLVYDSATGEYSLPQSTLRNQFSAGTALSYSAGQFSFTGSTSDVSEGTNQYFTQARARGSISLASVSAPDSQLLTYNSGTGALSVTASSVKGEFSAGTGLAYNSGSGQFSLNATTTNVAEGANLYYTDGRVRAAISAGSQADELISYDGNNGSFSLRLQELRYEGQVTLSANTGLQVTHGLGKKLVHVSAMDSAGNLIELDVVYNNTTQLTLTSAVGITVDIAVSL